MISLFGRDDYSILGIASILDIERIPYRRLLSLEDCDDRLVVVVTSDLSEEEVARITQRPALVMNGGDVFARKAFGASNPGMRNGPCSIGLQEPVWPQGVALTAASFGKSALRIPLVPLCETTNLSRGTILATLRTSAGASSPAIARSGHCVWSLADVGAAFANLLTENYLPEISRDGFASRLGARTRRAVENAYYAVPDFVRRWVQGRAYSALETRRRSADSQSSEYPVDATGWLLIELVKSLVKLAAGALVRIERWPAPFVAAATLTHDVEPCRYAYTKGLGRLLDHAVAAGNGATFGLVAEPSRRLLTDSTVQRLRDHDVICHGLHHRGENVCGRAEVAESLRTARLQLEQRLCRRVAGYRSPRLDRSPDLLWALDGSEFRYDSSYPDVDRENLHHFGGGVRLNVPYRPLVDTEDGTYRPSRCLELPLTAPDCIQPIFAGQSIAALRTAVETKAVFVRATGGLYVALVHAGVFGEADAALRGNHLGFVRQQLCHSATWLTSMRHIVDWWRAREALRITARQGEVKVINDGPAPVAGVRVVVEHGIGGIVLPVPRLEPGAGITIPVSAATTLPAA